MSSMIAQTALMRFLYLGNTDPVYVCSYRDPSYDKVRTDLACIGEMMASPAASPQYPFGIIQRVLRDGLTLRNTECIIALAYCVRCVDSDPLRMLVYANLVELLPTETDLFRFVHWSSLLKADAANTHPNLPAAVGRHGFGRGMKRFISQWYHSRTALQLANTIGRHRGEFSWTHKDLLAVCHVKFDPDDERMGLIGAMHRRGVAVLGHLDNASIERTPAMVRLEQILRFKVCESNEVAVRMWREHGFEYAQVPSHLRSCAAFWTAVLTDDGGHPLPYADFLRVFLTLNDHIAIEQSHVLKQLVLRRLGDGQAVRDGSGVHPLQLLAMRNAYAKGERPSDKVNAGWYRKRYAKKGGRVGKPDVIAQFTVAINHALAHNVPDMGSNDLFVTLDLRARAQRRRVFNMEHLECLEAMVCLALGLVKQGRTKVFAFTEDVDVVKLIKLQKNDDFEAAERKCKEATVARTKQTINASIRFAMGNRSRTFITIMDSAARVVRQGLSQFEEFEKYRVQHPDSRYILINLGRHKHDLHSYPNKGVLEICGLTPNVLFLIKAFVNKKFH